MQNDQQAETVLSSIDPIVSLSELRDAETSKKTYPRTEIGQSFLNYDMFVDFIHKRQEWNKLHSEKLSLNQTTFNVKEGTKKYSKQSSKEISKKLSHADLTGVEQTIGFRSQFTLP